MDEGADLICSQEIPYYGSKSLQHWVIYIFVTRVLLYIS
jgi:hypothetical protein